MSWEEEGDAQRRRSRKKCNTNVKKSGRRKRRRQTRRESKKETNSGQRNTSKKKFRKEALVTEIKEDSGRKTVVGSATHYELLFFRSLQYLSVAGEGGVVKQEVGAEKHHDSVVDAQDGPVDEDGPPQQRVLRDVSEECKKCGVTCKQVVEGDSGVSPA